MLTWKEIAVERERQKDLHRELERDRLAAQFLALRGPSPRLHHRALIWFGGWLVVRGASLQRRYGAAMSAAAMGTALGNVNSEPV